MIADFVTDVATELALTDAAALVLLGKDNLAQDDGANAGNGRVVVVPTRFKYTAPNYVGSTKAERRAVYSRAQVLEVHVWAVGAMVDSETDEALNPAEQIARDHDAVESLMDNAIIAMRQVAPSYGGTSPAGGQFNGTIITGEYGLEGIFETELLLPVLKPAKATAPAAIDLTGKATLPNGDETVAHTAPS